MTTTTDTAKLADEIEALAKAIERAKANPPEPSYHIDGGERSRAFDSYVHDLMSAVVLKLPTIIAALRELEAAHARGAKLREALEPFAEIADRADQGWTSGNEYGDHTLIKPPIATRHFRRARAALGGEG